VRVTRPDGSVVTGDGTNTPGTDTVTTDAQGIFSFDYIIRLGTRADYLVEILGLDGSPRRDLIHRQRGVREEYRGELPQPRPRTARSP
jgi:hypothetical protein